MSERILHVFLVAEVGGAERVILNFLRYSESPGSTHFALIASDQQGGLKAELEKLGVHCTTLPRGRMRNPLAVWRICRRMRALIRENGIRVTLTNSPQGYLHARLGALGLNLRHVLYYMTVPKEKRFHNGPLDLLTSAFPPSMMLVPSEKIRGVLRHWGLTSVQTVYHGTPEIQPSEQEVARVESTLTRYGATKGPVLLFAGRLQAWKGQEVLIEALPKILRQFPSTQAFFLGGALFGLEEEYPARLKNRIQSLRLQEKVHLLGHEPLEGWLHRASALIHASITPDPFPNVCIEALAARCPLVTNQISGTSEIVRHRESAFVVPPAAPDALADAVIEILSDAHRAKRIAEAGYHVYRATCTPNHMVRPMEAALEETPRNDARQDSAKQQAR